MGHKITINKIYFLFSNAQSDLKCMFTPIIPITYNSALRSQKAVIWFCTAVRTDYGDVHDIAQVTISEYQFSIHNFKPNKVMFLVVFFV